MDTVSVERNIRGSADELWAMVSDVTRMGEWSPETTGCRWLGGATGPAVGARFRGRNRLGWRRWSTTCTVVECEPGRAFAFEVKAGPFKVARWAYRFEPSDDACSVTETWTDQRASLIRRLSLPTSGVADRGAHNRSTMLTTLERLADRAEARAS